MNLIATIKFGEYSFPIYQDTLDKLFPNHNDVKWCCRMYGHRVVKPLAKQAHLPEYSFSTYYEPQIQKLCV